MQNLVGRVHFETNVSGQGGGGGAEEGEGLVGVVLTRRGKKERDLSHVLYVAQKLSAGEI